MHPHCTGSQESSSVESGHFLSTIHNCGKYYIMLLQKFVNMISSESLVCMDLAHAIFVRKTHFCRLNLTTQISIFCILYRNCTQTSDEGEGSALISHFWFFSLFQNWGDKSISSAEYRIFAAFLPLDRIRKCCAIFSIHYCERRHKMSSAPCVLWSDVSR